MKTIDINENNAITKVRENFHTHLHLKSQTDTVLKITGFTLESTFPTFILVM